MSPANQYKKAENRFFSFWKRIFGTFFGGIYRGIKGVVQGGRQKFTVMLIPHSEKKVFNFKISIFSLTFLTILLAGIVGLFFVFSTQFSGVARMLDKKTEELDSSSKNLEILRDELGEFQKSYGVFEEYVQTVLSDLGLWDEAVASLGDASGDFSSFFDTSVEDEGLSREVATLRNMGESLTQIQDSVTMLANMAGTYGEFLMDIPTKWPVQGGGFVTLRWGPQYHPFTGKWYLHKGLDITAKPGTPILAAADGKVVTVGYDTEFGNFALIDHAYGNTTKYAHMQNTKVVEGENVSQGQVIGYMGSSGVSTGTHLHFEIRLGSWAVDPDLYLNVPKRFTK